MENSYAVPTEVGKVGTESESFLEPVETRKDGIEAMFSKQKKNVEESSSPKKSISNTPPASPVSKGKRKISPEVTSELLIIKTC